MSVQRRAFLFFVVGAVIGVAGTILLPDLLSPYLPQGVGRTESIVQGVVQAKRETGERLLLTVVTSDGAILATFVENVPEVALLVDEGDTVSLALGRYDPFVTDPPIRAVRKADSGSGLPPGERPSERMEPGAEPMEPGAEPMEPVPDDTAPRQPPTDTVIS